MAQVVQREVLQAEREGAVVDRARSELELEKQRIAQLIAILSDFSTQASLLAGCAVAAVGAEALDSIEEEASWGVPLGQAVFVLSSAAAAGSSIWVIFISSHLISLTRDAALRPKIKQGRAILEEGVRDVRAMLWLSLAALIISTVATVCLKASLVNASIFAIVMFVITWQALLKKDSLNAHFREECGAEWAPDLSFAHFWKSWSEPWSFSSVCSRSYCRRGRARFRQLQEG